MGVTSRMPPGGRTEKAGMSATHRHHTATASCTRSMHSVLHRFVLENTEPGSRGPRSCQRSTPRRWAGTSATGHVGLHRKAAVRRQRERRRRCRGAIELEAARFTEWFVGVRVPRGSLWRCRRLPPPDECGIRCCGRSRGCPSTHSGARSRPGTKLVGLIEHAGMWYGSGDEFLAPPRS